MNIRAILIVLLLPVMLTATFLFMRRRFSLPIYTAAALACAVLGFVLWVCFPTVMLHYIGPLNASGFDGFAFVPAFIGIVAICAIPPVTVWRFFQPFVSVFWAVFWFGRYMWIA